MMKSMKCNGNLTMENSLLKIEELSILLSQIQACFNWKFLCPLSCDPSDQQVLTPDHFSSVTSLTAIPKLGVKISHSRL